VAAAARAPGGRAESAGQGRGNRSSPRWRDTGRLAGSGGDGSS
jgi:hypothetical protein